MSERSQSLRFGPISPAAPGALYDQIVAAVKREVAAGRLAAGDRLPSVRALAADLLVSVITVKRAYEELERDGIIYRRQGLGTFVSSAALDRSREAKTQHARELLREARREATEAGLTDQDVLHLLQSIIPDEREPRHVRKRD